MIVARLNVTETYNHPTPICSCRIIQNRYWCEVLHLLTEDRPCARSACSETLRGWLRATVGLSISSRDRSAPAPSSLARMANSQSARPRPFDGDQGASATGAVASFIARATELKVRYEYAEPGQLVHVDIKKLGKFAVAGHRIHGDRAIRARRIGWEHVYVCIDDASRLAYVEIRAREDRVHTAAFMSNAIMWFACQGISIERVLSDNGKGFRCVDFLAVLSRHGIRHLRTRPYRPCTNGKAERFIQTLLREWAYAIAYDTSGERCAALPAWLDYYNQERPHSALTQQAPLQRLGACQ